VISHFYPFIGINFDFYRSDPFPAEEGGRFIVHRPGPHTPAPGPVLRFIRAAFNRRGHLVHGARLSVLMRQSGASVSSLFFSRITTTGGLHLIRFSLDFSWVCWFLLYTCQKVGFFNRPSFFSSPITCGHVASDVRARICFYLASWPFQSVSNSRMLVDILVIPIDHAKSLIRSLWHPQHLLLGL